MSRRKKIALWVLLGVPVIWLTGDFIYSRVIAWRLARWEASVEWDESGVRKGSQAYSVGEGSHAVLLVHGINDSPVVYYKVTPVLVEEGFACRVMRLPGFGMSAEAYAKSTMEQWIAAVGEELAALNQKHDKVSVIAHSLGAAATIAHLREHPEAADSVALLAPAVEVADLRSPILPVEYWHKIGNRLLLFTRMTESPFGADVHDESERNYGGRMPFVPRTMFDETFRLLKKNRGKAEQFQTPLMVVVSRDDQVIDWRAAEQLYEQAGSDIKKIKFIEDAGHALPVDYGWKEMTKGIAEFFRSVDKAESDAKAESKKAADGDA